MPKQKQRKSRKRSRREPSSSSTTSSSSGSSSNSNGHKHKRSRCKSRETVSSEHYSTFTRADQGIHISMNALSKQSIIPRIARWVLSLQEFSFTIHHKAGTQMQHVDALSRNFNESQNKAQVLLIQEDDYLREAQDQDESIVEIKNILLSGDVQSHKDVFNNYDLRGNKVYKLTPYGRRWVVPKKCRWQIVKANHDDIGHFAVDKTLEKIKQRYWFPRMRHFITKYINACLPCLYHKDKGGKRPGYLHSIPKYARPHHTLHIDHLGPFVNTKQGNKYLIVVVDGFSKFVYLKAVPDTSAKYVIQMLTEMFAMLGNPRRLITDLGSAFTSKAFEEFVAARGIRLFTTAVGLPRGNDVRDERDVRMAVQSHSMSVAADRQIDGGWGKMTGRHDANAFNRFNAAQ
ncbi:unnamed protein product [Acanthoscelides obtectus]|uniref:RNA-directed DNA polymerase n=1 Tax=Acanthoscelides obtectus TaxID=200917 RepID=A0A9P0M8Z4_ACAOB|nr:unnamed protein product [Acanthoscelides obtectus]CAK1668710.1 Pro-Pol polyprotein [Acanthoscelides obtectus]